MNGLLEKEKTNRDNQQQFVLIHNVVVILNSEQR
jgi:hypothetical protein